MIEPGLIVIGSGPAGVSAAESFRKYDTTSSVQILTDDDALPYARPPLSKEYLRGESDDITMHPATWFAERDIDITHSAVDAIDTDAKIVTAGGQTIPYRSLILATGCRPTVPDVPGAERAHLLRSLDDATKLRDAAADARSAVVIGAGFIGCEAAASLARHGVSVTMVAPQRVPQLTRLGSEAGQRLHEMLDVAGVRYVGDARAETIVGNGVVIDTGASVEGDLVLAAIGVTPQVQVATEAGLDVRDGRIIVDSAMRTSTDGVFAAGDVALAYNVAAGRHIAVEHWGDAITHGEVAGASAAGADAGWDSVPGFWTTIGDHTLKHHAWGDGFEQADLVDHGDGFTIWYSANDVVVGVLTCNADDDYDVGQRLISERATCR